MRIRKNIDCLTTNELHELRESLAQMYALPATDPNSFRKLASFHGGPPVSYCPHGFTGFLTWHREYLLAFENALRSFGCNVSLPYWDWSSGPTTGVPAVCREPTYVNRSGATVANPLYAGPARDGGMTVRSPSINATSYAGPASSAQSAMTATTFSSFQSQVEGAHNSVHGLTGGVGGDMGGIDTAAYDPIFWLHHCNIDRLWAEWQADHTTALPAAEASNDLEPFNRPFTTEWKTGADVATTEALGYRYRRFCFVLPPLRLWEVVRFDWLHHDPEQIRSARLVLVNNGQNVRPLEVRAFVDAPQANGRTKTLGNASFAGAAGFMGHGPATLREQKTLAACVQCASVGHIRKHSDHAIVSVTPRTASTPKVSAGQVVVVASGGGGSHHETSKASNGDSDSHEGHDHHAHHEHSHGLRATAQAQANSGHGPLAADRASTVVEINLTKAFRTATKDGRVDFKLVAIDAAGDEVQQEDLGLVSTELIVE